MKLPSADDRKQNAKHVCRHCHHYRYYTVFFLKKNICTKIGHRRHKVNEYEDYCDDFLYDGEAPLELLLGGN